MNFLTDMFDSRITQAMPHVKRAGSIACMYGERVIARLDLILEAVQNEEFIEYHPRQWFTLVPGTSQDMQQIPTAEMWELESVTCDGAGATVRISEGADAAPRYACTFTTTDTKVALGLIFGGGTAPTITTTGANALVCVQFKRRKVRPARKSHAAGLIEAGDVWNGQPLGERDADHRHESAAGQRANMRGAALGDGLNHDPYARM